MVILSPVIVEGGLAYFVCFGLVSGWYTMQEIIKDAPGIAGPWGKIAWTTDKNGVRSFTPRFNKEK